MKSTKLMRVISLVMCLMICLPLLFGCGNETHEIESLEREEADTFSFDLLGGTDVMPSAASTAL